MTHLTPDVVIEAGREAYRMTGNDSISLGFIVQQVAADLDLEGEDYEDLVRHLVTADVIDEDTWRWVTQTGERAA